MWHRLRSDSASSNLHSAALVAELCNVNRAGDQRHNIGCPEGTFEKRWFPRPEHIKGWKPLSLTTPIVGAVVLLTLLIAAAVEVLAQRSQEYGGLAISPSLEAIPTYAMWSYLYGPNFVAIAYSMIWTWIDLDARRMQPWFELSKPEGATADNSLLLEYSFDFVAVVPWKSGRRKHWPVFLASTALMLVFWAVTPLQSALLATGVIDRPIEIELASTSELLPLSAQQDKLDSQLRGEIYFTTWLNLTYPSFTTPEYALLPFYVEQTAQVPEKNGKLSASTSKLWTELSCSPAKTTVGENISPDGVQWDNAIPVYLSGRNGCNATIFPDLIMMRDDPRFYMDYWGSYSAENDRDLKPMDGPWRWELASPGCPDVRNQFIAAWMDQRLNSTSGGAEMKINATWCEINYYKQRVRVSVDPKSFRPLQGGISNLGPRERLSDNEFNTTAFEKFMKTGQLDNGLVNSREQFTFQHEPWLFNHSLQSLVSWYRQVKSPVGYALAVDMLDIQAYADPEVLADAYNKAWKRQFAMSVHSLMTNSSTATSQRAVIMGPMTAIIVSRSFATAVESLLLFVALVGAALLWACRASSCHLQANPSSTKRLSHIIGNSPELIDLFTVMDTLDEDQLLEKLQSTRFRITKSDDGTFKEPSIEIIEDGLQSDVKGEIDETHHHYKSKKPFALHRRVGVGFLVTLVGVIIGLAYLKSQELSANGLKRPSANLEVRQLLENYIPTVMATLTEPFWLLLNRLLCLLQPFKDLSAGKASPKRSIEATYTAIPPQLVIWRALSAKHLLLAIVCITALLANVLTLSMGALFNEEPVGAQIPQRFVPSFAARIDKSVPDLVRDEGREEMSDLRQPYDIAVQANVTHDLPLPPWTTEDYYFQPVDLAELSKNDTITIRTRGFWLDTNCTFYPPTQIPLADRLPEPDNRGKDITGCSPASVEVVDAVIRGGMGSDLNPEGASKYEYVGTWPQRVPEPGAQVECDPSFSIAWGRTNEAQNNKSDVEVSKVYCQPRFQTSMFNVTVDGVGTVLSHEQMGKIEAKLNDNVSQDNMRILIATLQLGALVSPRQWSSDPLPMCGYNWLLSLMRKTNSLVDPKKSLPSKEEDVLPHVEKLFRKFFVSFLAFNTALFADANEDDWIDGAIHVKEIKIFMNDPAFIITMVVLGIYALVAVLFYAKTNTLVLPRMPTTIGSIIAYIAPSRLVSEGDAEKEGTASMTYSFGRYMGHDGKPHVGIEQDPFVVPIAPGSLEGRRPLLRRLGWRKKESERADGPWM